MGHAVSKLMRNIGRASFRITRDGEFVTSWPVFELFRYVNPVMNRFDLWKVISAWWYCSTDKGEVPILPDEIIHFKEWNP